MKYYITDTTTQQGTHLFNSTLEVVRHLEGTVRRKFNLTRQQYMQNLIDLGYGYDDDSGVTFVSSLAEHFNIGVIHSDGRYMRTNIFDADRNTKYRTETGD